VSPELHIASCVAFVRPEALEAARAAILATRIAEVPLADPRGRLVVLIERATQAAVLDTIDAVRALPGVLSVHLAYQHCEAASALEESHETHAT
jgi:nitrate reductase NapD